jgi:hypothetical protein
MGGHGGLLISAAWAAKFYMPQNTAVKTCACHPLAGFLTLSIEI